MAGRDNGSGKGEGVAVAGRGNGSGMGKGIAVAVAGRGHESTVVVRDWKGIRSRSRLRQW